MFLKKTKTEGNKMTKCKNCGTEIEPSRYGYIGEKCPPCISFEQTVAEQKRWAEHVADREEAEKK